MLVKNFEGHTMRDAMKKVKKEFGAEAIILATEEKYMEDTREKFYEVRAASAVAYPRINERDTYQYESANFESVNKSLNELSRKVSNYFESFASKSQINSLETEVKDLKVLCMELLDSRSDFLPESVPVELRKLFNCLSIAGIDKHHLADLVRQLKNKDPQNTAEENSSLEAYLPEAIQWFAKKIRIRHIVPESSKYHSFVGSSGAGKSSALIKIAAHFIKQKKKIQIITFDSQGLASHEQLRVYAKILNIPVVNTYGIDELRKTISESSAYDLVLIDNAGCFPYQEKEVQSFRELSSQISPIDFHVVLPLTEKQNQMDNTIRKSSNLGISSLIFTKLDESRSWGEMFNLGNKWSLPLSYYSTGPKIPDDLGTATREHLLDKIFSF